jgi:uncharacterized protein (TIGR04255 family)
LARPEDLPDFESPPLTEVVLGVQFTPATDYQQVMVSEVWSLYRKDFPSVQELPPLPPTFETFGLPQGGRRGPQINLKAMPEHSRYWFISPSEDELLQFQKDRLLHNWRKVGDKTNEYPRFDTLIEKFGQELQALETYFARLAPQSLKINQCEISYVNQIEIEDSTNIASVQEWLNFVHFGKLQPEDFAMTFRRVISNHEGKPLGRIIYEAAIAVKENNEEVVQLQLTFRGTPTGTDINAAIDFLRYGRGLVVQSFKEITTDMAHQKWGMVQ